MLIGKPLLEQVKATHNYGTDSISLPINNTHYCIYNFAPHQILPYPFLPTAISLPVHTHFSSPPTNNEHINVHLTMAEKTLPHPSQNIPGDVSSPLPPVPNNEIFTRLTDEGPFYPPRVEAILNMVQIGNITPDKLTKVCNLLQEFADVFALSIKEVKPTSPTKYQLRVLEGTTFSVKANQQPLNQA